MQKKVSRSKCGMVGKNSGKNAGWFARWRTIGNFTPDSWLMNTKGERRGWRVRWKYEGNKGGQGRRRFSVGSRSGPCEVEDRFAPILLRAERFKGLAYFHPTLRLLPPEIEYFQRRFTPSPARSGKEESCWYQSLNETPVSPFFRYFLSNRWSLFRLWNSFGISVLSVRSSVLACLGVITVLIAKRGLFVVENFYNIVHRNGD